MIPRVTNDLGTISTLDDRPNDTGGLTAAELKAKFDADSGALKTYLNDILLPYLESSAAAGQLGITTIPGYSAATVQVMLEQIVTAMQEITQGSVADKSITLAKLAAEVTAAALGGAAASHTHGAGDINSGTLDAARLPVLDATKLGEGSVGTGQLAAAGVTTPKIKDAAVTAEKIAALAVLATHIAAGAVTTQKLADKAVTAAQIADKTITATQVADATLTAAKMVDKTITGAKIADGAVAAAKLGSDITYTKVGLAANQVRAIYAGTSATPTSTWQPGDIYLQYE